MKYLRATDFTLRQPQSVIIISHHYFSNNLVSPRPAVIWFPPYYALEAALAQVSSDASW